MITITIQIRMLICWTCYYIVTWNRALLRAVICINWNKADRDTVERCWMRETKKELFEGVWVRARLCACVYVCVKKRYAWVHSLTSISVKYNMKLAVYHELSSSHVRLSDGISWLMLPSHGDTSELSVVPCGRNSWTRCNGTTWDKRWHTGTPRVSWHLHQ